jgi:beta-galactosidase
MLCLAGAGGPHPDVVARQAAPAARTVLPFDADWRFSLTDEGGAALPAFDDSGWRVVHLPHDWSAEGPFSADWGSGNGYAPGGIGWYRKHFTLDADLAGKLATIEFDGVYDHAEVWVNGHVVCGRPYGYSSFACPLTPYLRFGGAGNVVAVRVDHSRFADSRWYTGSGIYRHVRVQLTDPLHIAHWGTFVSTPTVTADAATVHVDTIVENGSNSARTVTLESEVVSGNDVVARGSTPASLAPGAHRTVVQDLALPNPRHWTPDSPVLYTLRQRIRADSTVTDDAERTFGVRTMRFDPARGFFLNGAPTKLKGVCVHHDAGSLGAAVPAGVWERRLRALKALGVNAIRTSHNPPAPEFLDLCDRLGLLVLDEAFDEFTPAKNKWVHGRNVGVPSHFGYAEDFNNWSVTDVSDLVRRDRNHPSVFAWSVGNEVDYPNDPFSDPVLGQRYRPQNPPAANLVTLARPLVDAIHALDPTRPVTAALASLEMSDAVGLPALFDIVGYNYQEARYAEDHARYPARVIFGSENSHQYRNWTIVRDTPYLAGQFLWTGIDYLGEAGVFPNRANGAGLLDLCGFKKPMAWFRQSLWSNAPMVYLAASPESAAGAPGRPVRLEERWNWPAGSTVAVTAYSNAGEVALTLNGRPLGTERLAGSADGALHWSVPFEAGVLAAVARTDGRPVAEFSLTTAGAAARVELVPDVTRIAADGEAVVHIEYRVVDGHGVRLPTADTGVTFDVQGPARVLGIGNADLNDTASGQGLVHRTWQGRGLAILQSTGSPGVITVRASAPGLEPAAVTVTAGGRIR